MAAGHRTTKIPVEAHDESPPDMFTVAARCAVDNKIPVAGRRHASGQLTVRFDCKFWSNDTIVVWNRLDVRYTTAVRCRMKGIAGAICSIDESAWTEIEYTPDVRAQVAECA